VFDQIEPKGALVLGGSGIIGEAICRQFGKEQWHVGIHYYHNRTKAQQTARLLQQQGGHSTIYAADVTNFQEVVQVVDTFTNTHTRLDALVYAVGVTLNRLLIRTRADDWDQVIGTNLTGAFHALKAAAPIFVKQQQGCAILLGSLSSHLGQPGQCAYAAAKTGLLGLLKSVAREWGPSNIRVNAVFPGWHASPLSGASFPTVASDHVIGQTPNLQEVSQAVYQLVHMKEVSGQIWNLDSRIW